MRELLRNTCRLPLVAICGVLLFGAVVPGVFSQDAQIKAGTLTCQGKGKVGLILGSKETLECIYSPSDNGPKRKLTGTITNVGLDIGVKGESIMVWTVLSSTTAVPAEALRGTYAGVTADVSLGLGAGAKVLVGGNENTVVLQPLSVQGQTGVNLAVGVSGFALEPR